MKKTSKTMTGYLCGKSNTIKLCDDRHGQAKIFTTSSLCKQIWCVGCHKRKVRVTVTVEEIK